MMQLYIDYRVKTSFKQLIFEGDYLPPSGEPLLLVSNHVGWWDGFWIEQLVRRRFKRRLRVMMRYESLSRHSALRYMGGFAVPAGLRHLPELIQYSIGQLENATNALLIFPQGALYSLYEAEVGFKSGVTAIIEGAVCRPCVLFVYLMVEYGSFARPSVYLYYEPYEGELHEKQQLQQAYAAFLQRRLSEHKSRLKAT